MPIMNCLNPSRGIASPLPYCFRMACTSALVFSSPREYKQVLSSFLSILPLLSASNLAKLSSISLSCSGVTPLSLCCSISSSSIFCFLTRKALYCSNWTWTSLAVRVVCLLLVMPASSSFLFKASISCSLAPSVANWDSLCLTLASWSSKDAVDLVMASFWSLIHLEKGSTRLPKSLQSWSLARCLASSVWYALFLFSKACSRALYALARSSLLSLVYMFSVTPKWLSCWDTFWYSEVFCWPACLTSASLLERTD
mmetsp:Transcript_25466/g.35725  ORF Transcript_25466/g.35725 Transcript_25466/m.35725 type:complete len:255 (+) Transcript_25466:259-1023(+)